MAVHYWNRTAQKMDNERWNPNCVQEAKTNPPKRRIVKLIKYYERHAMTCKKCRLTQRITSVKRGFCALGWRLRRMMRKCNKLHYKFHPIVLPPYESKADKEKRGLSNLAHSRAEAFRAWKISHGGK